MGFKTTVRERIRQEIEDDLWEQKNKRDSCDKHAGEAIKILLRLILGIPDDFQRIREEFGSGGWSRWPKKFLRIFAQRRIWLFLLIVLGFTFSMLFLGIGSFIIAGIIYIMYKIIKPGRLMQAPLKQ